MLHEGGSFGRPVPNPGVLSDEDPPGGRDSWQQLFVFGDLLEVVVVSLNVPAQTTQLNRNAPTEVAVTEEG